MFTRLDEVICTVVPRDSAGLNELIQQNEVPERGRAIQFAKRGVQWFAKRVL